MGEINKKIETYQQEKRAFEKKIETLEKRIKELEKEKELKLKELDIEKNNNKNLGKRIKELGKYEKIIKESNNPINIIMDLIKKLEEKESEINKLKSQQTFEILSKEKLINDIFISKEENIIYSITCKSNDKFNEIENKFYDEYPEFIETENYFYYDGKKINRNKTMESNMIKNNGIIILDNSYV